MDKIVQAAAELLLKCGKVSLPMDAGAVAKGVGYYVDRQSNGAEVLEQKNLDLDHLPDGLSIVNNGRYCIYYNDGLSAEKKNKVIAHEIGHIVLHLDWSSPYYLGPVDMDDPEDNGKAEAEADRFALHLIAPLSALYTAGLRAPDEIREVLGFSDDDCKLLAFELLQYAEEQKGQKLQRKAQKKCKGIKTRLFVRKHKYAVVMTTIMTVIVAALAIVSALSLSSINRLQAQIEGQSAIPTTTPTTQKYSSATDPGADPIANISAETTTTTTGEEQIVYITREGDKYHDANCRYVAGREDTIEMTEAEAQRAGYEACAVCGG